MSLGRVLRIDLWYELGSGFTFWPLIWAWAEFYVLTSDISLGRALRFDLWYELGPNFMSQLLVWAIPFMGLFHIPISPPPIAPQIFTLCWRERFDRNSGEINITIQGFEQNAVGSSVVGHSIREYGSVHCYKLQIWTGRLLIPRSLNQNICGNKINSFCLTLHPLDTTMNGWYFNSVLTRKTAVYFN